MRYGFIYFVENYAHSWGIRFCLIAWFFRFLFSHIRYRQAGFTEGRLRVQRHISLRANNGQSFAVVGVCCIGEVTALIVGAGVAQGKQLSTGNTNADFATQARLYHALTIRITQTHVQQLIGMDRIHFGYKGELRLPPGAAEGGTGSFLTRCIADDGGEFAGLIRNAELRDSVARDHFAADVPAIEK